MNIYIVRVTGCRADWNVSFDIGIDTNIEVIVVSLTTWEAHHSPRAVVNFPGRWWDNNDRNWGINFYFIMMKLNWWWKNKYCQFKCSKLSQKCPWLQHGYMCTSWGHVTWLFLLGNMCSNHCDVTVRFVTLNSNCTLNQSRQQNSHIILGKQIKINQNVLIRWYFENTNDLQWINCLMLNTSVFYLIFVIIILIRICFLKLFQSWV